MPPSASPADVSSQKRQTARANHKIALDAVQKAERPEGGAGRRFLFDVSGPRPAGPEPVMFPDLARDDVFRLETRRFWLRWPRVADAPAITRYSSRREVAEKTARIPHPYPPGEAERYIFTARAANAEGRNLTLAIAPTGDRRDVIGMISLEGRRQGRLTLGYALAPEWWGRGVMTEAARAVIDAAFSLTLAVEIFANTRVGNVASRRVLEKCGFAHTGAGLEGAPARGGMVESDRFRLDRNAWNGLLAGRNAHAPATSIASGDAP